MNGAITFGPCSHLQNDKFKEHIETLTIKNALSYNPYFALYISYLRNCTLNVSIFKKLSIFLLNKPSQTTEANMTSKQLCNMNLTIPKETSLTSLLEPARNAITAFAYAINDAQKDLCPKSNPLCKEVKIKF